MSFLVGLIPYVSALSAAVATEVTATIGSEVAGSVAGSLVTTGAGYIADTALSQVVDTNQLKAEAVSTLTFAQKIALARSGKLNNKDIIKLIKGPEQLKGTSLDEIKNRSELFVKEVSGDLLNGESYQKSLEKSGNNGLIPEYISLSLASDSNYIIPTDSEYLYVSSVYDGSVFFKSRTQQRTNKGGVVEFYAETERGTVSWWWPDYNNYNVIPTIWGYWTGMNSINNQLPYEVNGHQSLLDRIAHVHDCMYKMYGIFNKFADYVLISYIDHGLKQNLFILPGEKTKALIAINYFSSLGKMMRSIYGSNAAIYDLEPSVPEVPEVPEVPKVPIINELIGEDNSVGGVDGVSPLPVLKYTPNELAAVVVSNGQAINELISLINGLNFETD